MKVDRDDSEGRLTVRWGSGWLTIDVLPGEPREQVAQRILASVHPPDVARAMADSVVHGWTT